MKCEEWKAIPGYEGLYEASTLGRVRSLDRLIHCRNGSVKQYRGTVLTPSTTNTDYLSVQLSRDGKPIRYLVHRLVALTFIPNPDGLEEVNHKDGVKRNNELSNLEWMSRVRNIRHAMGMGLIQGLGEDNPAAKLTESDARLIKEYSRLALHPKELARAFSVKPSTITDIQLGRSWQHIQVSGQWSEIRKERGQVSRVTVEIYPQ